MRNICPECGSNIVMQTRDSKQKQQDKNYSFAVGYGKCVSCNKTWRVSQTIELARRTKQQCCILIKKS